MMFLIDEANVLVDNFVQENEMEETSSGACGLDPRAAHRLYIGREGIIVSTAYDRTLQYYGGFEYVDADYRCEIGAYVLYMIDASRVQKCVEWYNDKDRKPRTV